jgi:hypothetical protein
MTTEVAVAGRVRCACAAAGCARELLGALLPCHLLQWAHASGCPWDEETRWPVGYNGQRPVLLWARANGCLRDESTCWYAGRS